MPTSTKCRWVIGSWQKMILFLLTCEMNCFIFSLSDICYIKEGLPSDVSTGDQALFYTTRESLVYRSPISGHFGGLCWAISIRLFPRDVEKQKVPLYHRFRSYFYLFLLNKVKNWYAKSCFSYLIRWILQEKKYLCTQISVSWKEIEKFAKQISVYKSPNIILFALSTTDVSKEAR